MRLFGGKQYNGTPETPFQREREEGKFKTGLRVQGGGSSAPWSISPGGRLGCCRCGKGNREALSRAPRRTNGHFGLRVVFGQGLRLGCLQQSVGPRCGGCVHHHRSGRSNDRKRQRCRGPPGASGSTPLDHSPLSTTAFYESGGVSSSRARCSRPLSKWPRRLCSSELLQAVLLSSLPRRLHRSRCHFSFPFAFGS